MYEILLTIEGLPAISKRRLNREHRATWLSMGKRWRKKYLRGHFSQAGARKYGYPLRKGERRGGHPVPRSYTWTKLKRQGHTRPLEFYGDLKRRALSEEKLKATKDKVTVSMPKKANWLGAKYKPDLIRVIESEAADLEQHFKRTLEGRLARMGVRKTIRVGR